MNQEEKLEYIDIALKLQSISINNDLLKKIVKTIDLINKKQGKVSLGDIRGINEK